MGSISDFLENELLDHVLNASYTAPANIYLALATADPGDAATGASMNEVADANGYARTEITVGVASSRRVTQDAAVTFPQATGSWGTVSHWTITDSATHGAGNVLAHGAFAVPKAIVSGNTPSVASGEVYVEYTAGEISDYLSNELLDHVFNNAAFAKPTDAYVALCQVNVTDTDDGTTITEPVGGSYAREIVNENGGAAPAWNLAAGGVVDNAGTITFTTATAAWGTIVAVAITDGLTGGSVLFYDNAMADQIVGDGDTARFLGGTLDIVMT